MSRQSPREIAVRVLRRRSGTAADYVEQLLEQELARASLSKLDRALCQELVFGVVRWERALDWLITRKTSPRPQGAVVQLLLRLGLYQIFWLQRIPAHAAVNETVALAKQFGCSGQSGFLNAVLRGSLRGRDSVAAMLQDLKKSDPALGWSHPAWLVEKWLARWGNEKTAQLLEWNNSAPPTFARLNRLKTDAATLTARWEAQGIRFTPRQWDWAGENLLFELESHPSLAGWEDFQRGFFYIQDPGTLLAVHELNPQPGETILDLCAAPGGKTTYIAQLMQNRGRIVAHDTQPPRLRRLEENCARLGATCVTPVSSLPTVNPNSYFDRILVDAPCSNTGVLRRRVDLRWRVRPEEITRLAQTQTALLDQAAVLLKPGGLLLYSTCSLEPEENQSVTLEFLRTHPNFTLQNQRQLLPFADNVDGACIAALRHVAAP